MTAVQYGKCGAGAMIANLFTDGLPAEEADLIRRIPCKDFSRFRTDRLCFGGDNDSTEGIVQLRAQKIPETELWKIVRYIENNVGDLSSLNTRTIFSGLCFFDALHYCAKFQSTEKSMGCVSLPDIEDDSPHYSEVGEAMGQPFDIDLGTPVPAIGGEIIGDGKFNGTARKVAEKSRYIKILDENPGLHEKDKGLQFLFSEVTEPSEPLAIATKMQDRISLCAAYNSAIICGDALLLSFHRADVENYKVIKHNSDAILAGIFTAGLLPLYCYKARKRFFGSFPIRDFEKEVIKFEASVKPLPERGLCEEFLRLVKYSFHLETALEIGEHMKSKKPTNRENARMLSEINLAASCLAGDDQSLADIQSHMIIKLIAEGTTKKGKALRFVNSIWNRRNDNLGEDDVKKYLISKGIEVGLKPHLERRREILGNSPI